MSETPQQHLDAADEIMDHMAATSAKIENYLKGGKANPEDPQYSIYMDTMYLGFAAAQAHANMASAKLALAASEPNRIQK